MPFIHLFRPRYQVLFRWFGIGFVMVATLLFCTSCGGERDNLALPCACPYAFNIGLDSTTIDLQSTESNWAINLTVGDTIGHWLVASGTGAYSGPKQEKKEKKVLVRSTKDVDPYQTYNIIKYESLFCAKYRILCQSSLPEEEKLKRILEALERINGEFPPSSRPTSPSPGPKARTVSVITEPIGAEIYINNELKGRGTAKLELKPGAYPILVRAKGYEPYSDRLYVKKNPSSPQIFSAVLNPLNL